MNLRTYPSLTKAIEETERALVSYGVQIPTGKWQGVDVSDKPEYGMWELFNHSFTVPLKNVFSSELLFEETGANKPWAEDHFRERISGEPLNPGVQWAKWPYAKSADTHRDAIGQFTHTYMERYWPKKAGAFTPFAAEDLRGIRYQVGDLSDVIHLLYEHPETRQAFLPVWFPEDTGVLHGGRVPCTLGYHFIQRHGYIHVIYYIRSCDVIRHFRDDIYLTVRLLQHVLIQLRSMSSIWEEVKLGTYTQHTTSMHCFQNDYQILKRKLQI